MKTDHSCLALAASLALLLATAPLSEASPDSEVSETARTGTINLSGGTNSDFYTGLIYIIPILLAIIVLDFAIFGTFATRSDDLNPISQFFYHAREGLHILRSRPRRPYSPYAPRPQQSQARPTPHRVAR